MNTIVQTSNPNLWLFRIKLIRKITSLSPQITAISRWEQFYAITLIDKFLITTLKSCNQEYCLQQEYLLSFCMASINLVCKFDCQKKFQIAYLAKNFHYQGDIEALRQSYMKAESQILQSLDFQIPLETFYMHFQQQSKVNTVSQKNEAFFLKIFLVGLQFSTQLTQNPSYGKRILKKYRSKKYQDRQIDHYCQKIVKWSQIQGKKQY